MKHNRFFDSQENRRTAIRFNTMLVSACVISLALWASLTNPAYAWKIETHLWLADALHREVTTTGAVRTPMGEFQVPVHIRTALTKHRDPFLLGVLGPDTYPDMVAGQMTVHPGVEGKGPLEPARRLLDLAGRRFDSKELKEPSWQTDDWLAWVRDGATKISQTGPEAAFAFGYLIHAAMDMWAHSYVNSYAGDIFSLFDEQEVEFRHMAIESLVARTHTSLLPEPSSMSQQEAARKLAGAAIKPSGIAKPQTDILTPMAAPVDFVRNFLVLNGMVANQYAREKATLHLFSMYMYWNEVSLLAHHLQPLRNTINSAAAIASQTLSQAKAVLNGAQSAYNGAVKSADAAYTTFKQAEGAALKAGNEFKKVKNQVLGMIGQLTDQLIATLPSPIKNQYFSVKNALEKANKNLDNTRKTYDNLVKERDAKKKAMQQALSTVNLHNGTVAALNQARTQSLGAIDAGITAWRQGIERAVDAYIRAWEDTSKELMRPPGTRFSPGGDVTEPLKQWIKCWGPTLGLPTISQLSPLCEQARSGYLSATQNLKTLIQNALIPQPVRQAIEAFDKTVQHTGGQVLAGVGKLVSDTIRIDNGALAGYSRSIVNLRSKNPTRAEVDEQFKTDTSPKQLVIFTGAPNKPTITQLLYQDMGLTWNAGQEAKNIPLQGFANFAALQNSLTLAKLVLLDGDRLNALIRSKTPMAPYPPGSPAGQVLIGAVRSIDGDHQWQRHAPQLPRRSTQPFRCRVFGYGHQDKDVKGQPKGGLKLWEDSRIRGHVFNVLFKGPLTPGLVTYLGPQNLGSGFGVAQADPYPQTTLPHDCP
jgi:hypothetical protein